MLCEISIQFAETNDGSLVRLGLINSFEHCLLQMKIDNYNYKINTIKYYNFEIILLNLVQISC